MKEAKLGNLPDAVGWIVLSGVMLLWFLLTAGPVLFVSIDIRNTPESPVLVHTE